MTTTRLKETQIRALLWLLEEAPSIIQEKKRDGLLSTTEARLKERDLLEARQCLLSL